MAFPDALQDIITMISVSTGFKSGDTLGQEIKTETPLYTGVPGRLNSGSNFGSSGGVNRNQEGKQEKFQMNWTLVMAPQYNGGKRGDKVTVNSIQYIVTKVQEIRGKTQAIHHIAYILEEAK